jgi:polar amino acid transport system substrate-binding protein
MKRLLGLALAFVLVFGLSACGGGGGSDSESAASKVDAIKEAGEFVVYTNAEFAPYEYLGENGEIVGSDIELAQAIADELGVELKVENAAFDGLVASIASGKGDACISGVTITDERKGQVDFSTPYESSIQYMVLPEDSTAQVVEDLAGMNIGVQTGTTGQMFVEDDINTGVLKGTDAQFKPYNSAPIAMEDLKNGRLDAVVIDEQVALQLANQNEGYKAVAMNYENGDPVGEEFGVAIQKGNDDLLEVINAVIEKLLAEDKYAEWVTEYSVADEE